MVPKPFQTLCGWKFTAFKDKPTRALGYVKHAQEEKDHGHPVDQGQPVPKILEKFNIKMLINFQKKNQKNKKIPVEEGASHEGEQYADAAHELNETAQDPAHVCTGDFDYVNCSDG